MKEVVMQLKEVVTLLNNLNADVKENNSILRDFMGVSVKQWGQQQIFNEMIIIQIKEIKEVIATLVQL